MTHNYPLIATTVAVAIASGQSHATVPTLAEAAASPAGVLVIAGSSLAQPVIASFIENTICGGVANTLIAQSKGASANFYAYSCFSAVTFSGNPGIEGGNLITIYYRTEGDSVLRGRSPNKPLHYLVERCCGWR
jgi:hypothetical protein